MGFVTDLSGIEWVDFPAAVIAFILVYIAISWIFPHPVLKFFWWIMTHSSYRIRVVGLKNIPKNGPALLVSNHVSYIDWILLFAACPRRMRILVWSGYWRNPVFAFFLNWVRAIPIESRKPSVHAVHEAFNKAKEAMEKGHLVLIFPEGRLTRTGFLRPFHRGLEVMGKYFPVPIIPVATLNVWGSIFSYSEGKVVWKWPKGYPRRAAVGFGAPLPHTTKAPEVRRQVQRLQAKLARDANHWSKPVHRRFVRMAAKMPLRSCIIDPMNKRELNYGKVLAGAWVLRDWLAKKLGPEPVVALWIPPSLGGALANIAVSLLGKTSVNLNYTAGTASIASAVKQTGARQILTSKLFMRKMPLEIPAHEGPPDGDKVELIYLEDALGEIKNWQRALAFLKVLFLPGWWLEYVSLDLGRHNLQDLLTIIMTSGSTGEPKGVMLSQFNIASNIDSAIAAIDLGRQDRAFGVLPFFHSFGYTVMLWGPLQIGASVVYYPDPRSAKEIGEICKTYRCTLMIATATFLRFYLKRCAPDDFRSLRFLVCGAERLPPSLSKEFHEKFGVQPLEGYGCTEMSPVVSTNVIDREINGVRQIGNKIGTIGQCLPGVAAKVVNPDTFEEVPAGQEGLLLATGGNVMVGYLGKPEMTAQVIRDGWYVTGDVGHIDDDGFITLTGRLSRIAKVGGEMIPLEHLEEEIHAALGTTDRFLAVSSIPDVARGERLIVLHVELPGIDVRQLCQKLNERNLPNLWLPKERDYFQIPELPLLGSGKVDLKRLKQIALEKAALK
jgi:acyl-[acyl-carrier-protein]-phospholipid O-acyltransferase/long-chain-fatty-acid--[acyl-carrier-protein] ligase